MRAYTVCGTGLLFLAAGCTNTVSTAAEDDDPIADADDLTNNGEEHTGAAEASITTTAALFAYNSVDFSVQGSSTIWPPYHLTQPSGYVTHVPITEVRQYNVGDKDYSFVFQAGPPGIDLQGYTTHAPGTSYGTPNVVKGRYSILSFPAAVPAKWTFAQISNGQTKTISKNVFGVGSYKSFRTLWQMNTGTDDDAETSSSFDGSNHYFKAWGGNGSTMFSTQLVELAAPSSLKVSVQYFDVPSGTINKPFTLTRDPGMKGVVIAAPDSYITGGADQVSWNISCADTASSSTCWVSVTGGSATSSRVRGSMVLLQSP